MRSPVVDLEEARQGLFAALVPWLDTLAPQLPPEAARLRPLVAIQLNPTMGRLVLVSEQTGTMAEAARATEADLPGAAGVEDAAVAFIGTGLSAMPSTAVDGVFEYAARPGGGLVVVLDVVTGSARACFAPRGVGAERWVELFEIRPETGVTLH